MKIPQIIIDASVLGAALKTPRGSAHALLCQVGTGRFEIHDSVALVLKYEELFEKLEAPARPSQEDFSTLLDSLCSQAKHHKIYFLWKPFLSNVNDELILELAVTAHCGYIVTLHPARFSGVEKYGTRAVSPAAFLEILEEVRS